MTSDMAAQTLPLKGMLFDLPKEQQEDVLKRKGAILLAAGPGVEGFLALALALPELVQILEKETSNAP